VFKQNTQRRPHRYKSAWHISHSEWTETRTCFTVIIFQLSSTSFHKEGPNKSGKTGTEWITLAKLTMLM